MTSRLGIQIAAGFQMLLSGCIYDGAYRVRGTVRGEAPEGSRPIAGAAVATGAGPGGVAQSVVTTAEDGSYVATWRHGGLGFLFFVPGDGDPHLRFEAPGWEPRIVKLTGGAAEPGVARSPCEPEERGCFGIDVLLAPGRGAEGG